MSRQIVTWTVRIIIIVALLDGFADLGAAGWGYVVPILKNWSLAPAGGKTKEEAEIRHQAINQLKIIGHPGGARTLEPPGPSHFPIDADGLRHSPGVGDDQGKPRAMLLGSSVGFGFRSSTEHTLSAELARRLPAWRIDNAAAPGLTVVAAMQNFQYALSRRPAPQVAILIGGTYDFGDHCRDQAQSAEIDQLQWTMLARIAHKLATMLNRPPGCLDNGNETFLVNRILYDIETAQHFAAVRGVRLAVVIPPTPGIQTGSLMAKTGQGKLFKQLESSLDEMRQRLRERPDLDVTDLADAFGDHPEYFLDVGGHLSDTGSAELARLIAERLGPTLFARP